MTDLLQTPTIAFGELDAEDSRVLTRIYNTLDTSNDGLLIQWSTPELLGRAANITEEKAAAILKYLLDHDYAYYDESNPGLYMYYNALPDKYRKKLY